VAARPPPPHPSQTGARSCSLKAGQAANLAADHRPGHTAASSDRPAHIPATILTYPSQQLWKSRPRNRYRYSTCKPRYSTFLVLRDWGLVRPIIAFFHVAVVNNSGMFYTARCPKLLYLTFNKLIVYLIVILKIFRIFVPLMVPFGCLSYF
jgi:hypothetical protein